MTALPSGADYSETPVQCWRNGQLAASRDRVAEETPIALIYNGLPYAVMLATPDDLEDFALGFSLCEGIVPDVGQVAVRAIRPQNDGIEVWLKIPGEHYRRLAGRERNLAGRTGCGLCGVERLDDVIRRPAVVGEGLALSAGALLAAVGGLREHQVLNGITGSVHGAAWADAAGEISLLREDVGRHNALDKLIGALMRQQADLSGGFAVITSRASYEMVQKAATAGISLLVAVSAPTALAVRIAENCGLTLVGFARSGGFNVYSHPQRLLYH